MARQFDDNDIISECKNRIHCPKAPKNVTGISFQSLILPNAEIEITL